VFLFEFFAFFFAFGAFRFFLLAVIEFADLDGKCVSLLAPADGQLWVASFDFGWRVQNLDRVARFQFGLDLVTVGSFLLQLLRFAAFEGAFEIFTTFDRLSDDADDEAVSGAARSFVLSFPSFREGAIATFFALAAARFGR